MSEDDDEEEKHLLLYLQNQQSDSFRQCLSSEVRIFSQRSLYSLE